MNINQLAEQLNHSALSERKNLPEASVIYFVLAPTGQIMYVGRSVNLRQRWVQHHRFTQAAENNCSLAWITVAESDIEELESLFIERCQPPWNDTKIEGDGFIGIRIYRETRDKLKLLAALEKKSMVETLHHVVTAALDAEARQAARHARAEQQ